MSLTRRTTAAVLAVLVMWPAVAVAQDTDAGTEDGSGAGAETGTEAERVSCEQAPAVFELLCQSYRMLKEDFVDELDDEDLAAAAAEWVGRALDTLRAGSLVVIDYTDSSATLAARPPWEWVRTYRAGVRGHEPLRDVGSSDITVEVPLDQILAAHPGAQVCDQATFLRSLGIDDLVDEGRAVWRERASVGDLAALEARSRVHEAEALCESSGLGGFTVAVWRRE